MSERKWRNIRRMLRLKRTQKDAHAAGEGPSGPVVVDASHAEATRGAAAEIVAALQGFQALCEEHGQPVSVRQQYRGDGPAGASRTAQVTLFHHRFNRVTCAYALLFRVHAEEGQVKVLQGEAQLQGDLRHPQFLVKPGSARLKRRLGMDELSEQQVIDLLQAFLQEYQQGCSGSPS